jgi:hypothetical protein
MRPNTTEKRTDNQKFCYSCGKKIQEGEEYHFNSKVLCEECCVEIRTPRVRKTHWQYLGSIKEEYLIPGKKN